MAKDDDGSIFDELDNKLDDFFADEDDFFAEDDELFADDAGNISKEESPNDSTVIDERAGNKNDPFSLDETDSKSSKEPEISNNVELDSGGIDSENPLERLKAIVLEMDWEISEENLSNYLTEINKLIENYKNDRPIYLFFKLHAAIGNYMLTKKARAHPEALKFLYGVYNSLEKALTGGIPLVEKNKMILNEVNNFKSLKKKLFPGFYSDDSETENQVEEKVETDSGEEFDISSLPEDVQKGINNYIEKMISEKIESMSKHNY